MYLHEPRVPQSVQVYTCVHDDKDRRSTPQEERDQTTRFFANARCEAAPCVAARVLTRAATLPAPHTVALRSFRELAIRNLVPKHGEALALPLPSPLTNARN